MTGMEENGQMPVRVEDGVEQKNRYQCELKTPQQAGMITIMTMAE